MSLGPKAFGLVPEKTEHASATGRINRFSSWAEGSRAGRGRD